MVPRRPLRRGGGHRETGLSDRALEWTIDEFRAVEPGIKIDDPGEQIRPDFDDVLHGTHGGLLPPTRRAVPCLGDDGRRPDVVDTSCFQRREKPPIATGPYRPGRPLGEPFPVWAGEPWGWTGIYLTEGRYVITAEGTWLEVDTPHAVDGMTEGHHLPNLLHLVGNVAGGLQEALRSLVGDDDALTLLSPLRVPGKPWMALVGCVAATRLDHDDIQRPYDQFVIGARRELTVDKGEEGYLYAYANTAWGLYGRNRGSVTVTVTRD